MMEMKKMKKLGLKIYLLPRVSINVGFNRSMQRKTAMVNLKKNLHKIIVWPRSIIEVYRFNNIEVFVTYL